MHSSVYENQIETRESFVEGLTRQKNDERTEASGIPLLCEQDHVYVDTEDHHTLIFGNTGTKKTRNFIIPNVYMLGNAGESIVITDPKGEIYDASAGFLREIGYDIQVINLRDIEKSSQWNPLGVPYFFYCHDMKDRAMEMVSDFCAQLVASSHSDRDVYWENSAKSLLEGLILLLFEYASGPEEVTMENVMQLRMCIRPLPDEKQKESGVLPTNDTERFWEMLEHIPQDSMIRIKLSNIRSLKYVDRTLNSILSVLDPMLMVFMVNRSLLKMMAFNDIDMNHIGERPSAIFLIIPDEKSTFHFLASVFIKQLYEMLIYSAQKRGDHKLPVRVNFILDEFANLTQIKDMSSMISAARSRNIRFTLVIQSKAQLFELYGNAEAETIKSNCATWIILPCRELSLLQEISELCGRAYMDEKRGFQPLLDISDIQNLEVGRNDGQALVLRRGKSAYIAWVKDYESYPQRSYRAQVYESRQREGSTVTVSSLMGRVISKEHLLSEPLRKNDNEIFLASATYVAYNTVGTSLGQNYALDIYNICINEYEKRQNNNMFVQNEDLIVQSTIYMKRGKLYASRKDDEDAMRDLKKAYELIENKRHFYVDDIDFSIDLVQNPDLFDAFQEAGTVYADYCAGREDAYSLEKACSVYAELIDTWIKKYRDYEKNAFSSMNLKSTNFDRTLPENMISVQPYLLLMKQFDVAKKLSSLRKSEKEKNPRSDNSLSNSGFVMNESDESDSAFLRRTVKQMCEMLPYLLPFYRKDLEIVFVGCLSRIWEYYHQPNGLNKESDMKKWESFIKKMQQRTREKGGGYFGVIDRFVKGHT